MAIPVLKLNLAPEPSLWRQNHEAFGWGAVGLGALLLMGTLTFTAFKYVKASREAKKSVSISEEAQKVSREQGQLVSILAAVDVAAEMPRWKLAEKILSERSLPWSRLTAELERSLVQDVRVKSIQRTRGTDQSVQLALKGEARSRDAEVKFIEKLQANSLFSQILLEREAERQGGGLDFELKLPATSTPKPYEPLPEPEYGRSSPAAPATPVRPATATKPPAQSVQPAEPAPAQAGPSGNIERPMPNPNSPEAMKQRMEQLKAMRARQMEAMRQREPGGRRPPAATLPPKEEQ